MHFAIDTSTLHPSTALGLKALTWLHARTSCQHVLDMGCGNGILSVASGHLWGATVLATDIAPQAVTDTQNAALEYDLQDQITALRSDRFAHPDIAQNAPYDLIIANLLDQWLIEMATDVKKSLKPDGYVILSGMLDWLAEQTKQAYTGLGFEIQQEFRQSGWQAAVLYHKL